MNICKLLERFGVKPPFLCGSVFLGQLLGTLLLISSGCRPSGSAAYQAVGGREDYAGSASCRECHPEAFKLWANSHHGLAERRINPTLDDAAFKPARAFSHVSQTSSFESVNGAYYITSRGLSGNPEKHQVERVIGDDPLRQFLVSAPGGRWQTMEAAYDPRTREWFNVFGQEDRQPGEWGHWSGRGMNWNSMCAGCHNTWLRKNYDEAGDTYHTAMREASVACEACHGPLLAHVTWEKQPDHRGQPDPNFPKLTSRQIENMCASCHSRRGDITGDFKPGEDFFDHFDLTTVDHGELFYADGQIHDEDYEFTAFLGSKMHAAGVTCLDCHVRSLHMPRPHGNEICLRCHATGQLHAPIIQPEIHSHHQAGSQGDECIGCHMPVTTYMQRHPRHDHGFTIPDPLLTKELNIPNACNRCHAGKDTDWALKFADEWYGAKLNRSSRERARWIYRARQGDDTVREPLLKSLVTETNYYWQAVAVQMLDQWVQNPAVATALLGQLTNTSPLVRAKAIRTLEPLADQEAVGRRIRERLIDDSRSVRVAAAWVLRRELDTNMLAGKELSRQLNFNADQPVGQVLKGVFHQSRGTLPEALAHFQKAVDWDAHSSPLRQQLAVALSALGRPQEALAQLETACQIAPQDPESHFMLALACNETGDTNRALTEIKTAVRLDPQYARGWYNLALMQSSMGNPREALSSIERAEKLVLNDPWIPFTRATILVRLGDQTAALIAAKRALALNPEFPQASLLIESLRQQ